MRLASAKPSASCLGGVGTMHLAIEGAGTLVARPIDMAYKLPASHELPRPRNKRACAPRHISNRCYNKEVD